MTMLGNGLFEAQHHEDALTVREAELATLRRVGAPDESLFIVQGNLAVTYGELGHHKKALGMERDVYSGRLKLMGEEHPKTLLAALNYASSLNQLRRFEEAKSLLRKATHVARRVLGDTDSRTLSIRWGYAAALYSDQGATLDDLREAVATHEETERIARRVFGGAHPTTVGIESSLRNARAVLRARESGMEVIFN